MKYTLIQRLGTRFFHRIEELYTALRALSYVLGLQSVAVIIIHDVLAFTLPYPIAVVRKSVIHKRLHNRKEALFTKNPDGPKGLSGTRPAAYRDTKSASEVC